jgi:hypothetical protein
MFDIHQSIFDKDGEIDFDQVAKYIDGLTSDFKSSFEGEFHIGVYGHFGWSASMMDLSINYLSCTPATMSLSDFEQVLYGLFPRKVSVEAERAGEIVAELRNFWLVVSRQYQLDQAKEIADSLYDKAEEDLANELSDSSNFGMAKSLIMMGQESDFDMTNQDEINQFVKLFNEVLRVAPLDNSAMHPIWMDPFDPFMHEFGGRASGDDLKRQRQAKKRQRVAKKKNRSR